MSEAAAIALDGEEARRARDRSARRALAEEHDRMLRLCARFWSPTRLRYGLWYDATKDRDEALLNTDRLLLSELRLRPPSRILDAGCGVGGTPVFLGQHRNRAVGISLSRHELRRAVHWVEESAVTPMPEFAISDFATSAFASGRFDGVTAVESVRYADDPLDFAREAFRLLRPGGRLVVIDAFRGRRPRARGEQRDWSQFVEGLGLRDLDAAEVFRDKLEQAGFVNARYTDLTKHIERSAKELARLSRRGAALIWLPCRLGLLPRSWLLRCHAWSSASRLLDRRVETYGVVTGTKPIQDDRPSS